MDSEVLEGTGKKAKSSGKGAVSKKRTEEEFDQEKKFNSTEPTDDKEKEIWVELKRLFKPDTDDELWKLQKHIHDLTWKLYDSCRVQCFYKEGNRHLYAGREEVSIIKRNSYIDAGSKAIGGSR
nr:hypothetical protein [Tanacetum cinerariifolium]